MLHVALQMAEYGTGDNRIKIAFGIRQWRDLWALAELPRSKVFLAPGDRFSINVAAVDFGTVRMMQQEMRRGPAAAAAPVEDSANRIRVAVPSHRFQEVAVKFDAARFEADQIVMADHSVHQMWRGCRSNGVDVGPAERMVAPDGHAIRIRPAQPARD